MPPDRLGFETLTRELSLNGRRSVVLTGVVSGRDEIGAACYDRRLDRVEFLMTRRVPGEYHGTGDVFASVLTGALVKGETLAGAARRAVDFVAACAARSHEEGIPQREGVDFEPLLGRLAEK